jgi:hypothetical protein
MIEKELLIERLEKSLDGIVYRGNPLHEVEYIHMMLSGCRVIRNGGKDLLLDFEKHEERVKAYLDTLDIIWELR